MRKAFTLLELLVAIAIVGVLLGLLLSATQQARTAAGVIRSQNNQRQVALAFHNYASDHDGNLPSVFGESPDGYQPLNALLPYLGYGALYAHHIEPQFYDLFGYTGRIATFINPLDPSTGMYSSIMSVVQESGNDMSDIPISSYAVNAQFFLEGPCHMNRMSDGASQTIWLAEHYGFLCGNASFVYVGFTIEFYPDPSTRLATFARRRTEELCPTTTGSPPVSTSEDGRTFQVRPRVQDCDPRLPNASSPRGLQVAMGDGSVRILNPSIKPKTFWGMVTPNGGEIFDFE